MPEEGERTQEEWSVYLYQMLKMRGNKRRRILSMRVRKGKDTIDAVVPDIVSGSQT